MSERLIADLRAQGLLPPDYAGRGLANVPATVVELLGAARDGDLPALADLDPALREGVRAVVVILADGLGAAQLSRLVAGGDMPFLATILERARRGDAAQLLQITSVFPSTTAAAITTMNTGRTPQEHGNLAYFCWLEEFGQVAQMLRWGPATARRGSFFDDRRNDPARHVRVASIHRRLREHAAVSYLIEPEHFRREAMTRMHASEAEFVGYVLPTTMGVRLRELLEAMPWRDRPVYAYAYWAGIDTAGHLYGPRGAEHGLEASAFDRVVAHALADRPAGDVLVIVTADHGHALVDPDRLIDLEGDQELRSLLRAPVAGEPRLAFLHSDHPDRVREHLERRWTGAFSFLDRDEAIDAGLFGVGDATLARRRVGDVCAMLTDDRAATVVRVGGHDFYHRGAHGGMTHDEMRVPVLAWRA
ncbi:MAG TPA: alkaline phosphatase family protein [Candidatus Limnocylindrales bacterium]|nr:alkaline phosphatase family protein [Candidatus Limnocylindrales bacterium]